ncbi:MAG: tRNA 2-thiocytidine(32) synthetase TtcA [Myxococcales bacterium]|nr:tRNA 2-thiocytidine(32) synthetase TtcA [Myxococcales bacterium]
MGKTLVGYQLLAPGDHVLVAVSGGKDSYTLVDLLWDLQPRAPIQFQLTAVHLDQGQPGHDPRPLIDWLEARQIPHALITEDTYREVLARTPEGKAYCTVCSRLRRGILYTVAERIGATVIALGHHRDDALETLLLNLTYAGKLQAMPAGYRTDDGRFRVIRPLIECAESDLQRHAEAADYPILPCNLCGSQSGLQRVEMKRLLSTLEGKNPNVRQVMLRALQSVHPSHLLDRSLLARDRDPDPEDEAAPPEAGRRLPVLQ